VVKRRILFQLMSFVSSVCDARGGCLSLHPEHRMPVLTMMVCKVTTCLPWGFCNSGFKESSLFLNRRSGTSGEQDNSSTESRTKMGMRRKMPECLLCVGNTLRIRILYKHNLMIWIQLI